MPTRFLFEDQVLDRDRRELLRDAEPVPVEPQVFDLILYLVENRDRVVSKDDLFAAVWGGRIVSESALTSRINAARRALGDSGEAQRLIRTVARKGFRFVGTVRQDGGADAEEAPGGAAPAVQQEVSFCRTADGVNLAVGAVGRGPALIKAANWLNHLEYDWQSRVWAPFFQRLAKSFRLIRYDGRGNGLSEWNVPEISFETFVQDLETVVAASKLPRFALLGMSQGAAVAIAYAARHPERVSKLVLYGAYPLGRMRRGSPEEHEVAQAFLTLMRYGWGKEHSAFMQAFSSVYLPGGTAEQVRWLADMQRVSASAENAVRIRTACDAIDVVDLLPQVQAPTLVLHGLHDTVVPFEQGRLAAAAIPNARFVALESRNHVPLPGEPSWERMVAEIEAFAAD